MLASCICPGQRVAYAAPRAAQREPTSCTNSCSGQGPVVVAFAGRVWTPVVVAPGASADTRATAATLASMLSAITGAAFAVTESSAPTRGIAVGLPGDFSELPFYARPYWRALGASARTHIVVWSAGTTVSIVGGTEQTLRNAMWELLHQVGYRQYAPRPVWEVIPSTSRLVVDAAIQQTPRFGSRRIFFGFGQWPENIASYDDWLDKNQMLGGDALSVGHAWSSIIAHNRAAFDAHPEWRGVDEDGNPTDKFCVMAPGLQDFVSDWALERFRTDPSLTYISMEPSDGDKWGGCLSDAGMTVTDRVVTLANAVANAIQREFPGRYVTMYAYSQHSPAPTIAVHPQVVVYVATSYAARPANDLISDWSVCPGPCTRHFGIRDYLSLYNGSRDLPANSAVARPFETLPRIDNYGDRDAIGYLGEATDAWGPAGPSFWMIARALNAPAGTTTDVAALLADFVSRAFANISEMRSFYDLILTGRGQLLSRHTLGTLYGYLQRAMLDVHATPDVQARIRELVLYLRYVELWLDYNHSTGTDRQDEFETMVRFAYRSREHRVVHSYGLYRSPYDSSVSFPPGAGLSDPEPGNPWKDSTPFLNDEIDGLLLAGIAGNPTVPLTYRSFSGALVPANPPGPKSPLDTLGHDPIASRDHHRWFTWMDLAPDTVTFQVLPGRIYHNAELDIQLLSVDESEDTLEDSLTIRGAWSDTSGTSDPLPWETVSLRTLHSGLHRIEFNDNHGGVLFGGLRGTRRLVAEAGLPIGELSNSYTYNYTAYFYVPSDAAEISGWIGHQCRVRNSSGDVVYSFSAGARPEHFVIPVPSDQRGRLWFVDHCSGRLVLLNVPPYLTPGPKEMLLPESVVATDRLAP